MKSNDRGFLIGRVASRTGVAVSAIRFYEETGLIIPSRNSGGQRIFRAADIRRISFIIIAQKLGFSLKQIKFQLDSLPDKRTPDEEDWKKISRDFSVDINERIDALTQLRDKLSKCIGCGCLSLKKCAISNQDDLAAKSGPGPRFLLNN